MPRFALLALIALIALVGCKSVDDYLVDLDALDPQAKRPTFEEKTIVFDGGQLSHEALTGLATADEMALWQSMRSLYHGSRYLRLSRENELLQSDGAVLIGEIVQRVPVPPLSEPLQIREDVVNQALKESSALLEARHPLQAPLLIAALGASDEIAAQGAYEELKDKTGEDFGRDAGAWESWWESVRSDREVAFQEASRVPLSRLGQMQFETGSEASAILSILSFWLQNSFDEELTRVAVDATLRVARQAAVLSLRDAMKRSKSALVRADIAEAMGKVRDPIFGEILAERLTRESDPVAAAKMARALRFYPGRDSIIAVFNSMRFGEPQITLNASETLSILTGKDLGDDLDLWVEWWKEEGSSQWP